MSGQKCACICGCPSSAAELSWTCVDCRYGRCPDPTPWEHWHGSAYCDVRDCRRDHTCAHDVRHANTGRCTRCGQNGGTS